VTYAVRAASTGDLAAVLSALHDGPRPPSERERSTWDRICATPDVTVYVVESDGLPVGTVCLQVLPNLTYECRPTALLEALRVHPDHRRRGVATMLVQRLLADARAAGCDKVQLLSHKRHAEDGAFELYRSLGFHAEAEGFRRYLHSG
jgi:GNAT superfamily N-acetyltransferase